jgi:hypothetical protein
MLKSVGHTFLRLVCLPFINRGPLVTSFSAGLPTAITCMLSNSLASLALFGLLFPAVSSTNVKLLSLLKFESHCSSISSWQCTHDPFLEIRTILCRLPRKAAKVTRFGTLHPLYLSGCQFLL